METPPLRFRCACGSWLETPAVRAGRLVRCPACGHVMRAEHAPGAESMLVDRAPLEALPPPVEAASGEPSLRDDVFLRILGDLCFPVFVTWAGLLGTCLWLHDDLGELPARIMYFAWVAGFLNAGYRLPQRTSTSLSDSIA